MNKLKIISGIIFTLIVCLFVLATIPSKAVFENSYPSSETWFTDGSLIEFNISNMSTSSNSTGGNVSGFFTNFSATWDNVTGTYHVNISDIVVDNNTIQNYTVENISDGFWAWYVTAWNLTDGSDAVTTDPWIVKIDSTDPIALVVSPLNRTANYTNTTSVIFKANCTDLNPNEMFLDINNVRNETRPYSSGEEEQFPRDFPDGSYYWNIVCDDDAGNIKSNETNSTITIDTTFPVITNNLVSPSWDADGLIILNITVIETNVDTCNVHGNFTDDNSILYGFNQSNSTRVHNDFTYDLALGDSTNVSGWIYSFECNDTVNHITWSSNYSIGVDTADPIGVGLLFPHNTSTGSDYKPNISFVGVPDLLFSNYTILVDTDPDFGSPDFTQTITDNNTNNIELTSSLIADTLYYWTINTTAVSGRTNSSNQTNVYTTDSICHTLLAGYNYCGIVRDSASIIDGSYLATTGITLDQIQRETDSEYIFVHNLTHSWITYQNGTSTNKYYNVTRGEIVVLYTSSDSTWPIDGGVYDGRLWSSNQSIFDPSFNVNFTNYTDAYNLVSVVVQEGRTLNNMSNAWDWQNFTATSGFNNGSLLYTTYINNSGIGATCTSGARDCGQFVSHRWNWSINDNVAMSYGEAFWVYFNGTIAESDSLIWNRTCDVASNLTGCTQP